jgi:hypothetical protein
MLIFFVGVRVMMFNATFSNISAMSWQSVLLVEETKVPRENNQPTTIHWQTLSHNVVTRAGFELTTLVVIATDWIDSCKSKYHTITKAPIFFCKFVWKCKMYIDVMIICINYKDTREILRFLSERKTVILTSEMKMFTLFVWRHSGNNNTFKNITEHRTMKNKLLFINVLLMQTKA